MSWPSFLDRETISQACNSFYWELDDDWL